MHICVNGIEMTRRTVYRCTSEDLSSLASDTFWVHNYRKETYHDIFRQGKKERGRISYCEIIAKQL